MLQQPWSPLPHLETMRMRCAGGAGPVKTVAAEVHDVVTALGVSRVRFEHLQRAIFGVASGDKGGVFCGEYGPGEV